MIVTYMKPRFRMKVAFFDYDWTLVKPINVHQSICFTNI